MPKGKPREGNRKDIWLTGHDFNNVDRIAEVMKERGVPILRGDTYSLSQIVRFALDEFVKNS